MKRRTGSLLIAILFLLICLAGCGSKQGADEGNTDNLPPAESETPGPSGENPLTGMPMEEEQENARPIAIMLNNLKAALPQVQIVSERNLVESASARRKLAEAEGVILVEERGNSKYSVIAQELELAKNVNTDVIGVIVA